MKIPTEEIEYLDDGAYKVCVGKHCHYVSSSHLITPHVNERRRKYQEEYTRAVQPYLE